MPELQYLYRQYTVPPLARIITCNYESVRWPLKLMRVHWHELIYLHLTFSPMLRNYENNTSSNIHCKSSDLKKCFFPYLKELTIICLKKVFISVGSNNFVLLNLFYVQLSDYSILLKARHYGLIHKLFTLHIHKLVPR